MEQHLEDLARAQKKKLSVAQRRAMELEALRPSQDAQTLKGMPEGEMISGGEAGLRRVVGGKLRGGAYRDSQFGVINEPYSNQLEGGAKYGKMLGEHLLKTKGGAFGMDFGKALLGVVGGPLGHMVAKTVKRVKGGEVRPEDMGVVVAPSASCKAQRAKNPYSKVVLPCEADAQMATAEANRKLREGRKPRFTKGMGVTGGAKKGKGMCPRCGMMDCMCGGAPTGGAMCGGAPTGGKRTLPPALRKRADAMKRLIREEGMTFKEAIEYLKRNPLQ